MGTQLREQKFEVSNTKTEEKLEVSNTKTEEKQPGSFVYQQQERVTAG